MRFRRLFLSFALATLTTACTAQKLAFYGGDVSPDDPNAYAFPNGNTLLVPDTHTYGCISIPYNRTFYASGLLFNVVANVQEGTVFDPMVATYDVRRSIETGEGGIDMRSGTAPIYLTPTGRTPFGETEYSAVVRLHKPMQVPADGEWCMNVTPQCTDASNSVCSQVEFFVDNTTQRTNAINPQVELDEEIWVNSSYFGYDWVNYCNLGLNAEQCGYLSFGVFGY